MRTIPNFQRFITMKQLRIALMVVVVAMTSVLPGFMYANTPSDEDSIQVNDVNDSGCIRTMRESSPKNLVLKKEGDILYLPIYMAMFI